MTAAELKQLPLVLKPWMVKRILGLSDDGLRTLRESQPGIVIRQCGTTGRGSYLYSKQAILQHAKLPPD